MPENRVDGGLAETLPAVVGADRSILCGTPGFESRLHGVRFLR